MAIVNNKQATQSSSNTPAPKFTGVAQFTIQAVNPNNAKLKDLGFYVKENSEEPARKVTINAVEYHKLTIAGLAVANINGQEVSQPAKFDLLMLEGDWKSGKSDNVCFINQLWKTKWAISADVIKEEESVKLESGVMKPFMAMGSNIRKAFRGERELMELIGKANKVADDLENTCTLDSKPFSKEWFKEIENLLVNNTVGVVFGYYEKDGNIYTQVITQMLNECFLYAGAKPSSYFTKKFMESLAGGKLAVQGNLEAKFFTNSTTNDNQESITPSGDALPF